MVDDIFQITWQYLLTLYYIAVYFVDAQYPLQTKTTMERFSWFSFLSVSLTLSESCCLKMLSAKMVNVLENVHNNLKRHILFKAYVFVF